MVMVQTARLQTRCVKSSCTRVGGEDFGQNAASIFLLPKLHSLVAFPFNNIIICTYYVKITQAGHTQGKLTCTITHSC